VTLLADERRNFLIGPSIADALGEIGDNAVVVPLTAALSSGNPNIVLRSIMSLSRIVVPSQVPPARVRQGSWRSGISRSSTSRV
jgi:hypothetical protein